MEYLLTVDRFLICVLDNWAHNIRKTLAIFLFNEWLSHLVLFFYLYTSRSGNFLLQLKYAYLEVFIFEELFRVLLDETD